MIKTLTRYFSPILFCLGCLFISRDALSQTTTFATLTGGVQANNSTITAGASQVVLYGFSVQVSGGSQTFTQFNLSCGSTSQTYLGNGTLYRSSTSTFSSSSPGTPVGNVVFNGGSITISNLTETISSATDYYFLVADLTYTGGSINYSFQVYANTANFAMDSGGGTAYPFYGSYQQYQYNNGTAYPVTVSNASSGLASTSTIITSGSSTGAVFGFSLTATSITTFNQIYINSNITTLSQYFSGFTLYTGTSSTYSAGSVTAVPATVTLSGGYIKVVPTVAITATTTATYYWLVGTCSITGSLPVNPQFYFLDGQSNPALKTSGGTTYNDFTAQGPVYNLNSASLTVANLTGGTTSGTLTAAQTGVVLFGFSVATASGTITVSGFNINSTNTAATYFGNGKLYRSTTNNYTTGTLTQVGSVTFSGNYAVVTGLSESISTTAKYYFLVADNTDAASSGTIAFNFTAGQSSSAITQTSPVSSAYNTFTISGNTLTLPSPTFVVTGANSTSTNGITASPLTYGETNMVLFGFGVTSFGTTAQLQTFNIQTSGSENAYFTNGRLYRSTTNVFPGGTPAYTSSSVSIAGGGFIVCTVNETIPAGTTYYYWFVADENQANYAASQTNYTFKFTSGQSQAALITTGPYATYNTYNITGNPYNIGGLYDWTGATSTSFTTTGNFSVNGGTPATVPGVNDAVRIGVSAYSGSANQPTISASQSVGTIIFGTNNTPTLTVGGASATTLTITNGIITNASSTATIANGSGNGALSFGANASTLLTASSTLNSAVPITNAGDISVPSGSTLHLTGSGAAGALTNSSTGTMEVSGTLSVGGALTNTGTITLSGTAPITVTGAVANNSPGSLILAGGAGTFSSTITNASGATLNFGSGNNTITGNFSNAGIFDFGTGTNSFNSSGTFTNTSVITQTGGTENISAATFSNTSPGTFTSSGGTVNFALSGAQAINNTNASNPVVFNNLTLSGSGAKTLDGSGTGKFSILSSGVLTLSNTTLAAGTGLLTLISDANGSATVAALPSGTPISGSVYAQRYITGGSLTYRGYRMISSPVSDPSSTSYYNLSYLVGSGSYTSGVAGGGFDVTGNPSIFLYRDDVTPNNASLTVGNFRAITKINNSPAYGIGTVDGGTYNLPVGTGIFYFFRGNNGTVSTTVPNNITLSNLGPLNQGQITYKYWYSGTSGLDYGTATGNAAVIGFNMAGNPYASSIDWHTNYGNTTTTSGICCSTNLSNSIYVYNATTKNYSIYTNTSATAGTASGSAGGSNIIPSGQGFFVRASGTGARLIFNESAKVSSQPSTLLLTAVPSVATDRHIRIQLFKDTINKDETVIIFNPAASAAFNEQEDALYLQGTGLVNLSNMTSDNQAVGLNQQPFPTKAQSIALNVLATNDGTYSLNATEVNNIPNLFDVWLKDAFLKDSVNIKTTPNYSFSIAHSDTTTFGSKRFSLVIRQNAAYAYKLLMFTGTKVPGGAQLNWTTQNEDTYTVFALQRSTDGGKTFTTLTTINSTGAGSYSYLDTKPATGDNQYRLQQTDYDGGNTFSNVVDLNYPSNTLATGNINIYPNPVANLLNVTIITSNNAAATYSLMVTTSSGDIVKTYTASQNMWQGDVSDLKPGLYIIKAVNNTDKTIAGISKFIKL